MCYSSNHINDAAFSPKTFHQPINSETEPLLYGSGCEPMKNLPCDTKHIPTPTVMHTNISSCHHGCALDGAITGKADGSVHGPAGGVLTLSIYNDNEVCGSEPVNDLSDDIKTIPAPTVMHTDNFSYNHGCAFEGAITRQGEGTVHGAVDGFLTFQSIMIMKPMILVLSR